MAKKQFKAESKRLLDLMINSIYTHKEIFLREIISNSSDAIDKLYYKRLGEESEGVNRDDYRIRIAADENAKTLTISDNGIGMTKDEMETNLGTIAQSGSFKFKKENGQNGQGSASKDATAEDVETDGGEGKMDIDIIGQFGVGFYSAFMVSKNIRVVSRAYGSDEAYVWESKGADGYTIEPGKRDEVGTDVILTLKDDTEEENYSAYLKTYQIRELIKKYSDYIRYPIIMNVEKSREKAATEEEKAAENYKPEYEKYFEDETLNSMVPIWKRSKSEISDEDYNDFYKKKFYDFTDPARVIHTNVEGVTTYNALLFIPGKAPYNYYTKEYEKGLQLYSSGVMIMEKCADLLPDYFSFVKGLVDSQDLSLNISREMLQHDRQLKAIASRLEKKIKAELLHMLENDREKYEEFFKNFGLQLKFGLYSSYGMHKDVLQDLILLYSSSEKKPATFKEYISRMKEDQKYIYYACGESIEKLDRQPQTELLKDKGYEIFYCTDEVDEFALRMIASIDGKEFKSVSDEDLGIEESEEEKKAAEKKNEDSKEMLEALKAALGDKVSEVKVSSRLKTHPVCFASGGGLSIEMEKVLNAMPAGEKVKAQKVLEINPEHPVFEALGAAFDEWKANGGTAESKEFGKLGDYAGLLYNQALLIEGMPVEDPVEFSNQICKLMK